MGFSILACLNPLGAERNSGYFALGFQYSYMSSEGKTQVFASPVPSAQTATTDAISGSLFGGDLQLGYRQFLGKKKRFGLRYYVMFSAQGGRYSYPYGYKNNADGTTTSYTIRNGGMADLFYGAGMDALFNFFDSPKRSFGVFGGVALGGTSWLLGDNKACPVMDYVVSDSGGTITCNTMDSYAQVAKKLGNKAHYSPSFVQFAFNFGVRGNFSKHNGFEVGVRVPVINTPYFTNKDNPTMNLNFRRVIALFANYVVNF
ncbi:outer membrane protein [Helicobacter bizzozeronii]|uniref:outer membrane protein n=1 Tax=Helicobacter bizzozeronii TaxID=56877 RepID=UPI001F3F793D|nr:outer membrane protein [Helicobacter bizzozeronii]